MRVSKKNPVVNRPPSEAKVSFFEVVSVISDLSGADGQPSQRCIEAQIGKKEGFPPVLADSNYIVFWKVFLDDRTRKDWPPCGAILFAHSENPAANTSR